MKKILASIGFDNGLRLLTLMVILAFSFVVPLSAATYHVDCNHPQASDNNPGTQERPWKTVSKAAATLKPGNTVIVHEGVYREWVHPKKSGTKNAPISYIAAPGEEVIITGADIFTDWQQVEDDRPIYKYEPWTLDSVVWSPEQYGGPSVPEPIGRQEQVICDGKLLRHVLELEKIEPGTFVSDTEDDVLYIWLPDSDSPAAHTVEVSVREHCFGPRWWGEWVDYIVVKGFTMRYGRNKALDGILNVGGNYWIVENNIIEWSNSIGLNLSGEGHIIRNNTMQYNGQIGMDGGPVIDPARGMIGRPVSCLLEGNKFLYNNLKGYPTNWGAGGCKIHLASNTVISDTVAIGNIGSGIWFDIDNRTSTITRSLCMDNTRSGIHIEISGKGGIKLTDNVCVGNGFDDPYTMDWPSAGIDLDYSEHCIVENNVLVGNKEGLVLLIRRSPRTFIGQEGKEVSYYTHDDTVRRNIIAFNLDYQLNFWGDFGPSLDPEKRNLIIDNNLYYGLEDRILVQYGEGWRPKSESYTDLADWQAAHSFDHNSIFADPLFEDLDHLDLRLKPNSPAFQLGFQPFELSPEWRKISGQIQRPPLIPQGPKINDGFEHTLLGALPTGANMIVEEEGASVRVTDEQAATGRHSLRFTDVPSLESDWKPQMSYLPHFTEGVARLSFDLWLEPGAIAWMEWLDMAAWGVAGRKIGPKLKVDEAGQLKASDRLLMTVPLGEWFHVEIVCGLGPQATGFYDLTVTIPGQKPRVFTWFPCVDWDFRLLRRVALVSQATQSTAFYLVPTCISPRISC